MIKLDPTKLDSFHTEDWYLNEKSLFLEGVTSESSNLEIGILDIFVNEPSQVQEKAGIVALVKVRTIVGTFSTTVFRKQKNENLLYLQPLQISYEDPQTKEKKYKVLFSLNSKVTAQILRYVTTLCITTSDNQVIETNITHFDKGSEAPF